MNRSATTASSLGPKQVVLVFLGALVFYLAAFHGLEHLRHRKGPWMAEFSRSDSGDPVVTVRQSWLGIAAATLRFPGEQAGAVGLPCQVRFDRPGRAVPFGEVVYEDLMFLPGVVTFNLFGHEVELLPRTLVVNKREVAWRPGLVVALQPESKPAPTPRPPRGGNRQRGAQP